MQSFKEMKLLFFIVCLGGGIWGSPSLAAVCPDSAFITPCTCSEGGIVLQCTGNAVTQAVVDRSILLLRLANNLTETELLYMQRFEIRDSVLTSFDLSAFVHVDLQQFNIHAPASPVLESITGPPLDEAAGLINVKALSIQYTALTDEAFGDTLRYFNPQLLKMVFISYNKNITGTPERDSTNMEFLPGLSELGNLTHFSCGSCGVMWLHGGQFRKNYRLENLAFTQCEISVLGEDAFLIEPVPGDVPNTKELLIYLNVQHHRAIRTLNARSWHENTGVTKLGRKVYFPLDGNAMETLPQKVFEPFLDAHPDNAMRLEDNPIFCDPRLKWIKDRSSDFYSKVFAMCINDPGKNVFTSTLIDL